MLNDSTTSVEIALLTKRNRWTIFAKDALIGMVASAAAITGSWAANVCPGNVANPECWITFVAATVAGGIAIALSKQSGSAATTTHHKRSIDFLESAGYLLNPVNTTVVSQISTTLSSAGLTFLGLTNITMTSLVKRDVFNATEKYNLLINWESEFGTHVGAHMKQNWTSMLNDIVTDPNPGSLESTLRYTDQNTSNLKKRWNYFEVDWISWNFDNVNHNLDEVAASDRLVEEEEYDSAVYDYFNTQPAWKYCLSVFKNDHVGRDETYNDLGTDNAVHGELYFNTYGGVDGFCNDNKDGAQCSGEACQT